MYIAIIAVKTLYNIDQGYTFKIEKSAMSLLGLQFLYLKPMAQNFSTNFAN